MADIQTILNDPDFKAASDATKREILIANDDDFRQSSLQTQDQIIRSLRSAPAGPSETDLAKRAALPTILGTAGGIGGGLVGGLPGALIGSGLGAAAGEGLNQLTSFGRTETPGRDILIEGAGGLLGEGVGRGLALGGKALFGAMSVAPRADAPAVGEAFRSLDVPMKPSDVAAGTLPSSLETSVGQMLLGRGPIRKSVQGQADRLTAGAEEFFLKKLGPDEARSTVETGTKAANAIKANVDRTRAQEDALFQTLEREAQGVVVDITAVKAAAQKIADEQSLRTPGQQSPVLQSDVAAILNAPDQVPWKQARAWQKGFGSAIERGELISNTPSAEAKLLWKSVTGDMEQAIAGSGSPALAAAFSTARDFATQRRALFVDSAVSRVLTADPEDVVKVIDAAGGPTAIKNARAAIDDPDAWNYVRRHIFEGLFDKARDANARGFLSEVISGTKLDRQLKRVGEESLASLLSPTERAALKNVQTVADSIRSAEKYAATGFTSMTAQSAGVQGALVGAGAYLGSAAGLDPVAAGVLTYVLVPPLLAKALTNPRAAEIIASPAFAKIADGLRLGGRIGEEGIKALSKLGAALATDVAQGEPVKVPATRGMFSAPR